MIITRRSLLGGLGATLIVAPSIVRAASLMPVKSMEGMRLWASFFHPDFKQWMFAPLDTLPLPLSPELEALSTVNPMGPEFSRMMNEWAYNGGFAHETISPFPLSIETSIRKFGSFVHHALRDRTL